MAKNGNGARKISRTWNFPGEKASTPLDKGGLTAAEKHALGKLKIKGASKVKGPKIPTTSNILTGPSKLPKAVMHSDLKRS